MKKNYKSPLFRPVSLAGASSLMAGSGHIKPSSDGFEGSLYSGGTSDEEGND